MDVPENLVSLLIERLQTFDLKSDIYFKVLDRRRHNSFSGETEELTARLDATLTKGNVESVALRQSSHASPRRLQTNRTLSDSAALLAKTETAPEPRSPRPDLTAGLPPIPPPRMRVERKNKHGENSPPRLTSNGLPPTPKVHMGACFMKVIFLLMCHV
jgi:hypothetical protein